MDEMGIGIRGRNAKAAKCLSRHLIAQFGSPGVVIADKLRRCIKSIRAQPSATDHRAHKGLNKAIEVSNRPTQKREKNFGRFKSPRQAQRFLSAHDQINIVFRPRRYSLSARFYRHTLNDAFSCENARRIGDHNVLVKVDALMDWPAISTLLRSGLKRSGFGPQGYDPIVLFKCLLLGQWPGFSDPKLEESLRIRFDFMLFAGLDLHGPWPMKPPLP